MPFLKVTKSEINKQRIIQKNDNADTFQIHSFDPQNFSMPKYSTKYLNGSNAGAVRHLLGGVGCPDGRDIRSSNIHW